VASVSKQFTAAAILLLAQDGKLSLDDDVHKYIAELPDFGAPITIRQLVHHTSGLRDQWALLGLVGWRYSLDLIADDDVMELTSRQKDLNFYRIVVANGGLVLKRLKSKPQKLQPTLADYFQGPSGDLHFQRDQSGRVTGFLLDSGRIKNFRFRKADQQ
jgi:CubicO group peptidase (beta-lactamase class C family)